MSNLRHVYSVTRCFQFVNQAFYFRCHDVIFQRLFFRQSDYKMLIPFMHYAPPSITLSYMAIGPCFIFTILVYKLYIYTHQYAIAGNVLTWNQEMVQSNVFLYVY